MDWSTDRPRFESGIFPLEGENATYKAKDIYSVIKINTKLLFREGCVQYSLVLVQCLHGYNSKINYTLVNGAL